MEKTDSAGSSTSHRPTPQCVGREFVRQYYTLLNQVRIRKKNICLFINKYFLPGSAAPAPILLPRRQLLSRQHEEQ